MLTGDARRSAEATLCRQGSDRRPAGRDATFRRPRRARRPARRPAVRPPARISKVFIVKSSDETLATLDLVDPVTTRGCRHRAPGTRLTRIGTNNRLRRVLKTHARPLSICRARMLRCGSPPSRTCCGRSTKPSIALLRERVGGETDPRVKEEIDTGLRSPALDDPDADNRLQAVATLSQPPARRCAEPARALARQIRGWHVSSKPTPASDRLPRAAVQIDRQPAGLLSRHRNAVLRSEPRIGAGAGRDRPRDYVRRHGRHQHGARRADDARRVHHLRGSDDDAEAHRRFDSGRDSCGVCRRGAGRRHHRAHDHPLSLRPTARDAARDVRRQPGAAAARPIDLFRAQPLGRNAVLDERHAADQRSARRSPTTGSTS